MKKSFNEMFSERLRLYMEYAKMTQKELAKRMETSEATVSYWIKGLKVPRADKVDKLCEIFNCKRSDLVDSNTEPASPIINEIMEKAASLSEEEQQEVLSFARFLVSKHKEP